jgi:hypothetical protein
VNIYTQVSTIAELERENLVGAQVAGGEDPAHYQVGLEVFVDR